ncbi:MAG: phosphoribosylformylglycinamidine synthase, partial [Thermoprotei archaeon]
MSHPLIKRVEGLPFQLHVIDIHHADDKTLVEISETAGLSLSLTEMKAIQAYFKLLGRPPTDVELQAIAIQWSEHCFHKTFKGYVMAGRTRVKNMLRRFIAKVVAELKPEW